MRLSKKAIRKISNRKSALKIALAVNYGEQWVRNLIAKNQDNGPLTMAAAIKAISEDTGLSQNEILEPETIGAEK